MRRHRRPGPLGQKRPIPTVTLPVVAAFLIGSASSVSIDESGSTLTSRRSASSIASDTAATSPTSVAWSARYRSAGGGEGVSALAVSPGGSAVYVTGNVRSDSGSNFATIAYKARNGQTKWVRQFDGQRRDFPTAIAASSDGTHLYVSGWSLGGGAFDDATLAYDARTGERLWTASIDEPFSPCCLEVDPTQDRLYVFGSELPGRYSDSRVVYRTIAMDGATGEVLWSTSFSHEGAQLARFQLTDMSADGDRLFVSAYSQFPEDQPNPGTSVVAYNTETGTTLWTSGHPGAVVALASDAQTDRLFVSGYGGTIAFDISSGDELWSHPKGVFALAVEPSGRRLFLMGRRTKAVKAETGSLIWETRSPTATLASGAWINVSSDGRFVYEAGSLSLGNRYRDRFAVGAYRSTTGRRVWKDWYDQSARNQFPAAFGVTPDDSLIFVAGRMGYQRAAEFLTVAFSLPDRLLGR